MAEKNHKSRLRSVLVAGLIYIAFGVSFIVYAITVVERSRFPADSYLFLIVGFSFEGLGMGYLACRRIIRDLEEKIRKLEEELHERSTKTA